jgi:superfamily II DNA or RNA helicase
MIFKVGDMVVEASGSYDEMKELRGLLRVKDPRSAYKQREGEPEYIDFVDEEGRFLRGLMPWVHEEITRRGIAIVYDVLTDDFTERPFVHCPPDLLPNITPRDYQLLAAEQAFNYRRGIVQIATGGGKSAVAALIAAMIERFADGGTLTMVNKKHLLRQTVEKFHEYGLQDIGVIGAGVYEPGRHTVAMVQSLWRALRRGADEFAAGITGIIWDETHHLGANSWAGIAYNIPSKWSIGLSATPFREGHENTTDPADMLMQGIAGKVLVKVSATYLIERGLLAKPSIFMIPVLPEHCEAARDKDSRKAAKKAAKWAAVESAWISDNPYRNQLIVRLCAALTNTSLNPLVLVQKIEHGKELLRLCAGTGLRPVFLSGGPKVHLFDPTCEGDVRTEQIEDSDSYVSEYLEGGYNVLIGSTVFDEGVDLPAVTAVINCAGGKAFIRNIQRVGRGLRPKPGDNRAFIFDFVDLGHSWVERHSIERIGDYKSEPAFEVFEGYQATKTFFGGDW